MGDSHDEWRADSSDQYRCSGHGGVGTPFVVPGTGARSMGDSHDGWRADSSDQYRCSGHGG
eukprot:293354-Hanusia_phi.AAC.1